jgi:Flp pilus assembly protein TadG
VQGKRDVHTAYGEVSTRGKGSSQGVRNRTKSGRHNRWHSKDERGASTVEFALVLPVFLLLLFALVDFGLVFSGYTTMRSGVSASARLASLDEYTYSGSATCSGGPNTDTEDMVCTTMSEMGKILAIVPGSIEVGICFTPYTGTGGAGSCAAEGSSTTGTQSTPTSTLYYNVEICAQATMKSTTGLTAPFLNNKILSTTSTNRLELGLGSNGTVPVTLYDAYNSSSTSVTYNGTAVKGMNCT